MHDFDVRTEDRLRRFVHESLPTGLVRDTQEVELTAWEAPGEPVPFADAVSHDFTAFSPGTAWGKPWGTTWFHVRGQVPERWADVSGCHPELVVDLGFTTAMPGFQAEALAWRPDGTVIKGVEPRNAWVPVGPAGSGVDLYLEGASNPTVQTNDSWISPTLMGDVETAPREDLYVFRTCAVQLIDDTVRDLGDDIRVLRGLMVELSRETPRRHEILAALEHMLDVVDPDDLAATASEGRRALAGVLADPASASAHRTHAVGHAHIDSAWLWSTRETVRKCARTFSNVLDLMDQDPDFAFACSSAQQYAWIRDNYPELFRRIGARVKQGRFVPTGGMWVESDTNMPGGEALARQFVVGTNFFVREFGFEPKDVWLPDSFGYTGAMPEIAVAAGKKYFLTQKISWNDTNTFPHHTFWWEGIDGTRIFTHFPPSDTYNSNLEAGDLAKAQRQFREKGPSNTSLLLFGFGDGGGGPTREMVAAGHREADLEGSPKVIFSTPQKFFDAASAEYPQAPVWHGELYLEYHRGTYTSQHRTKAGNRRSEHLLREAELWAATAAVRLGREYPYDDLAKVWETVLLQQFHDILPGTAIAWVYREAERKYAEVATTLEHLIGGSLAALTGPGELELEANAAPDAADQVGALSIGPAPDPGQAPTLAREGQRWVLDNGVLHVVFDADGVVTSLVDLREDREIVPSGHSLGLLHLYRDLPNEWEAWDINSFYRHNDTALREAESVAPYEGEAGEIGLEVVRRTAKSTIVQRYGLVPGEARLRLGFDLDWHERRKLLKLELPLDVRADDAAAEIQFGHIRRSIHENTSWDAARFEVCAHRWVHVGEPGYGVGLANSATYGYSFVSEQRDGGGTFTTVLPSLVRAPMFPDPESDQGHHSLVFDLLPGATILDAVEQGYRTNLGRRVVRGGAPVEALVSVEASGVEVESVKLAEDRSGDVIVRLYEALGNRASAHLGINFAHRDAVRTDLLERPLEGDLDACDFTLRPFEIATVRISR